MNTHTHTHTHTETDIMKKFANIDEIRGIKIDDNQYIEQASETKPGYWIKKRILQRFLKIIGYSI